MGPRVKPEDDNRSRPPGRFPPIELQRLLERDPGFIPGHSAPQEHLLVFNGNSYFSAIPVKCLHSATAVLKSQPPDLFDRTFPCANPIVHDLAVNRDREGWFWRGLCRLSHPTFSAASEANHLLNERWSLSTIFSTFGDRPLASC
jgi:hypothetical protein